jgi:glyoxylase-like metal-dependent hydrolase (beta-lactamase superfamily II)
MDDWRTWVESLDRVAALAPRIIMPGHGPVATGEQVPELIESVREVLRQAIAAGRSPTS